MSDTQSSLGSGSAFLWPLKFTTTVLLPTLGLEGEPHWSS